MRRSTLNLLAIASVLYILGWPSVSPAEGQRSSSRERRTGPPFVSHPVTASAPVEVWAVELQSNELRSTPEAAIEEVWSKARNQVANLVRQYRPDLAWFPPIEFLKKKLRASEPKAEPVQDVSAIAGEGKYLYTARLQLELTAAAREDMLHMVRLEVARDRQWILAKGLLAVLAVLIAVAGYLRLTERNTNRSFRSPKSYVAHA
jgi:hypothetical protein